MTRLSLPQAPAEPQPASFPIFAVLAPVVGALALFAFLQSPYVLLFAVLGPLIAIASIVDQRLGRRRQRRRSLAQFEAEAEQVRERARQAAASALAARAARHPGARELAGRDPRHPDRWRWQEGELAVVIGTGACATGVTVDEPAAASGPMRELYAEAVALAGTGDGPVLLDATRGIGLHGSGIVTASLLRTLLVQVLDAVSPEQAVVIVEGDDALAWLREAPHRVQLTPPQTPGTSIVRVLTDRADITLATAPEAAGLPRECGVRIAAKADAVVIGESSVRPHIIAACEAAAHLEVLTAAAVAGGLAAEHGIPAQVDLADLPAAPATGLAATFLMAQEPVTVDLVADGPHAVVGGTTGSGKSELLVAWVTALAAAHGSERLNVLLVDFKGGASFGELERLQHCVGLMTDLDEASAVRAIESLSAELRRRERALAELGVKSIDDTDALPRLVVVVDEFAAMLQELPDLHRLFVDIAARGRSLGVHLILCTQRPADAVRDALMTNCGLRLCLRVNDAPDSVAVIGAPDAAGFELEQRGRCAVRVSGQGTAIAQTALAGRAEILAAVEVSRRGPVPRRPYLPPLPERIAASEARAGASDGAVVFAWADRPAQQRQDPVQWHPSDGSVVIIGSASSGRSTAAQRFCDGTDAVLVRTAESLWDVLDEPPPARTVVIDDLDLLLMQVGDDHAHDLTRALQRRMREASGSGRAFVMTVRRLSGALSAVAALAEHTIVLRMPTRQEHLLAGAAGPFAPDLAPGAGWLGQERIQLVLPQTTHEALPPRVVEFDGDRCAVVAARPEELPPLLRRGSAPGQEAPVIVGTAAQWESAWGAFEAVMQDRPVLLVDTAERQLRTLLRGAVQLPFCSGPARWLVIDGRARRLRL